ncbi:adenosine kinase [Saccharopolyspora erythraea NRRL 2338]|uniref:Adenosine kinase n=2 Tax=Saccharopolyspora erythraea TaxID=1836 RepID=A4FGJ5_SACEN|nr:carbohydrate kinase family protein [Saccharopolyspora erythraea]EQD83857.1 ribokinase [Saccharopolyspora erythraea D]PFG96874.1 adenosine kinase [Saccharopolyspora erythraea NRRL 2338]QRK87110.1 carbohydrate kinase family protein [Saccharopolyspora erythraea]CAM03170.1 adenosine kinase [Saccharopolyspora erythraea NRRL 2338]
MRIAVTGSIATDHLMAYPGRFAEQLIADQLEQVSLSFLVDDLQVRRGGIAANITFGLGQLGTTSVLVGSVGEDFEEYRAWLERHGVDTKSVRVSGTKHTARFLCTTDQDLNQIASFYAGAMQEAREIELKPIADRLGGLDIVVISPNDPEAMVRHTQECRDRGYKFLADPGQQLARMGGEDIRKLVGDAEYLFTNEYEHSLLLQSTGWSHAEVLDRVGMWLTSLGPKGVKIESKSAPTIEVAPPQEQRKGDPTGVGDALRAGFLAGLAGELSLERSVQLGCTLATVSLETDGPQEYVIEPGSFVERFAGAYGEEAAAEIRSLLS